jgi:hypothetical protein
LPVGFKIGFVADQQFNNILVSVLIDLCQPVLDVFEGLSIGDVVDQDDAVGSLVVGGGDGLEPFLAGSVPDLQLDGASSRLEGPDLEVDADRGQETTSLEPYLSLKMLSENLRRRLLFPTEEFPMRSSLKR